MNIKQIEKILTDGGIEPNEAKIEAKMLVKHFLKLSDIDLALNEEFEENDIVIERAKFRAKKRIPIQHIIGTAYFMGEDFIVNENVLIPRDETEILVRKAVEKVKRKKEKGKRKPQNCSTVQLFDCSTQKVLDIGTGSGCIACMIAKLTDTQVLGVDVSIDALQVAIENSSRLKLFNKAIFRKSDIFSNVKQDEKFDMIISNPPYIPISEKKRLQTEVGFEPDLALFAKDIDGVEFYEKITTKASEFLNEGGYLMFELGINQADAVRTLMTKSGFKNIEIEKDLAGIERVIFGKR
ncbi:MAG: peptide chain release factor N(5)-glutamine methyltransferase [bacterium]